ncbi:MAG: PH domain-containing protein [Ruminococcus sp.]|jgi:uncharacterized membrane protein YdbT with pleckstrin-like domain|nr:PH domain-containing protein [Ruminococcus sp.]
MKFQHPIAIVTYTTRKFWLLIIPLLRNLAVNNFDVVRWLGGSIWDILLAAAILGVALIQYFTVTYEFLPSSVIIKSGFFVRREFEIRYKTITAVTLKETFWARPLRAVKLFVDTDSHPAIGTLKSSDLTLVLDRREVSAFKRLFRDGKSTAQKISYKNTKSSLLLFSFFFSEALSGAVYLTVLVFQSGRLITDTMRTYFSEILSRATAILETVFGGIPVAATVLAVIALSGWVFTVLSNMFKNSNFTVNRRGRFITIRTGIFSRWTYMINSDYVNYADFRQNLPSSIFGLYSLHIGCTGYGKQEIPLVIPIAEKNERELLLQMFFPQFSHFSSKKITQNVPKPNWARFIIPPIIFILIPTAAIILTRIFTVKFSGLFLFLSVMALIPACVFFIVSFFEYKIGGKNADGTLLRYRKGFIMHTVVTIKEKICMIQKRQSLFQKKHGLCDLTISTMGEKAVKHKVRSLNTEVRGQKTEVRK